MEDDATSTRATPHRGLLPTKEPEDGGATLRLVLEPAAGPRLADPAAVDIWATVPSLT